MINDLSVHSLGAWLLPRFRRYVRKLWEKRGGGFYGFVATLMFLYLEVIDIAGDILDLGGVRPTLGWILSFVISNMVTVLVNTVRAAVWPITWISQFGVGLVSAALMGGAYAAYRAVRPSVMRWLEASDDVPQPALTAQPEV
jgi:hypothetical protein